VEQNEGMALIKCYECEKEISDKAPACPHCGAPKEEQPPQIEEAEILESVAAEDEPEPITNRLGRIVREILTGHPVDRSVEMGSGMLTERERVPVPTQSRQETASAPSTEPEPVATKDERFNLYVTLVVGAFVWQIARTLGIGLGFLLAGIPMVLLHRYGKKQSPRVYAGIIAALFVVLWIAIAAGLGDEARLQRCLQRAAENPTSAGVSRGTIVCRDRFSARDQNRASGEQLLSEIPTPPAPPRPSERVQLSDGRWVLLPEGMSVEDRNKFLIDIEASLRR
jgi:hypothetical protein